MLSLYNPVTLTSELWPAFIIIKPQQKWHLYFFSSSFLCHWLFLFKVTFSFNLYFSVIFKNKLLLCVLIVWLLTDSSEATATQSPPKKTVESGQSVTITCETSLDVGNWCSGKYCLSWYLKKPGDAPKLLIHQGHIRYSSTPSRFSGSGSGKKFQLVISGAQNEDSGEYYCFSDLGGYRFTPW